MMTKRYKSALFATLLFGVWLLAACNPQTETEQSADSSENGPPTLAATAVPADQNQNSAAESGEEPTLAPTNTPVPPTATPEESANAEPQENAETSAIDSASSNIAPGDWTADARIIPFDTFEFGYEMNVSNNGGTPQIVGLTIQGSKPLSITTWTPNVSGVSDPEMLQLNDARMGVFENSSYMFLPSFGCIWSNDGAGTDEMLAFNTDNFLAFDEQPDAQFVGTETVNGLETFVYAVGEQTLTEDMPEQVQLQEATGMFYLYPLPTGENLIVKSEITMISNYDMFNESYSDSADSVVTTFTSEIVQLNESINISIPAECEQQATDFPYPIMDGGQIQGSMPGISIVSIPGASSEDVVSWYEAEMVNNGWTVLNVMNFGPATNIDVSKDGQTVTMTITEDPSTGDIIVSFIEN